VPTPKMLDIKQVLKVVSAAKTTEHGAYHRAATRLASEMPPRAELWVKRGRVPFKLVALHEMSENCQCGRRYNESHSGSRFAYKNYDEYQDGTLTGLIAFFEAPVLCQHCWYYKEWKAGRWVMRYWLQRFENDDQYGTIE
jgi:hypothetical protein